MLRKTTCAAAGVAIACAVAYSLILFGQQPSGATSLDLRWLYTPARDRPVKADRLPVREWPTTRTVAVDIPAQSTTVAAKAVLRPIMESAVQAPRTIRTIRVEPVREVPTEEPAKQKKPQRLPEGCEPAFSPVTTPAFAHISARCDS
jgi:hypothetical protein